MSNIYYLEQKNEVNLFTHASKLNLPILIKGPTGCGKTRFVEHMGEKLNRKVYTVCVMMTLVRLTWLGDISSMKMGRIGKMDH